MARGWESKSVESQIDSAQARNHSGQHPKGLDPEYIELLRQKETLVLSRTRVLREIQNSQNPRYKEQLSHALADLDEKLTQISKACGARPRFRM